ncbi:hypothetical protein [Streptomyces olivaceoviridis]|uniref:hypothetical protein n=1 Tax=Streptomyces olivaceoviridis TaxID=1921 RepID=UPI0036CB53DA
MHPPSHGTVTRHQVTSDTDDFGPAVAALAARAQAVVYCGDSSRRAASCAGALRAAGFTDIPGATQAALAPEFLRAAGAAAEAYNTLGLVAHVLHAVGPGPVDRGNLTQRLRAVSYRGITRTLAFRTHTGKVEAEPGCSCGGWSKGRRSSWGSIRR